MLVDLEYKLLNCYKSNNLENIDHIYNKLFKEVLKSYSKKNSSMRKLKNYLIGLNSSIYSSLLNLPVCKVNLHNHKEVFNRKISKAKTIEEIHSIGLNFINYYSNLDNISIDNCRHPLVNKTIKYIHSNLDQELNLEKLSKEVNLSKNYLSSLFSKFVDYSFSDYINKLRIEKAKKLLKTTDLSLLDIAYECGFKSQSYFSSVFKKFEKISPKQYQGL